MELKSYRLYAYARKVWLLIVLNGIEISQNLTVREHLYLLIVLNGIEITRKITLLVLFLLLIVLNGIEMRTL